MYMHGSKSFELGGTATVGPKGQVVIPVDIREQMGVKPGDKLVVLYLPAKHSVGFLPAERVQRLIDKMGESLSEPPANKKNTRS